MVPIIGLDHVVLRVRDLDAMLHFYRDTLGCPVERELDIGLVQLRAGSSLIDLVPVDSELGRTGGGPPDGPRNMDHFCLQVEPFEEEAIRATLAARGYRAGPVESRYGARGDGPSIYVEDPEGNTVELKGPPFAAVEADDAVEADEADDAVEADEADEAIQRMPRSPGGAAGTGHQQ